MNKQELIDSLKGKLIVSCQTEPKDVIHEDNRTVVTMAKAAEWGGAAAIRSNCHEQVKLIHEAVNLPIIGLEKVFFTEGAGEMPLIMTPTVEDAKRLWDAGARIIAVDATDAPSPYYEHRYEVIPDIKKALPDALILGDIDTTESALKAVEWGADMVAPTLYGYTPATIDKNPPDYRDVARMCRECGVPVLMEGHIYTPEDAMKSVYLGCHAVVVGSAITRPQLITKRFADLLGGLNDDWRKAEMTWNGDETNPEK